MERKIPGITFNKTLSMCLQRIKIFFEGAVSITWTGKAIFLIKDITIIQCTCIILLSNFFITCS